MTTSLQEELIHAERDADDAERFARKSPWLQGVHDEARAARARADALRAQFTKRQAAHHAAAAPARPPGRRTESGIRIDSHSALARYAREHRALFRDIAFELEFSSGELYAVLCRQAGHPLLFGLDVRVRARRVCRRLDRMGQLAAGGAIESVALYREFLRQFAPVLQPAHRETRHPSFDFND